MSDRLKIVLKLIGLVALATLIGFFLYLLFFKNTPVVTETPTSGETANGTLPGSTTGTPTSGGTKPTTGGGGTTTLPGSPVANGGTTFTTQLTSSAVTTPTLTSGNKIAFYDKRDGHFYTIDSNGNLVALSDKTFPEAETVVFSPEAEKAAIEFPDGSNVLYDFTTEKQVTLPSHWEDFAFSPDSGEVVSKSLGSDPNSRALTLTNSNGSQTRVIALLGENASKVTASWSPNNNVVAFSETGSVQSGFGRHEIYLIGQDGEAGSNIIVDGENFSAAWAPSGNAIVYSVADPNNHYRATLWYTQTGGQNDGEGRKKLGAETVVDKCTWSDEATVYCAVPKEGTDNSGVDTRLIKSMDDVYKINVTTGKKTLVAIPAIPSQMFNLQISDDGSLLYFTDILGHLNSMRLK